MVKKFAMCLRGPYIGTSDAQEHAECISLLTRNDALHVALRACKNLIGAYHQGSSAWDTAKRRTNEYELLTPGPGCGPDAAGIAAYVPISRSFFKLHEMLHDYWDVMDLQADHRPLCALFLAEGPGGFMEAFARFRATRHAAGSASRADDRLHGITLAARSSRNVPAWRLHAIERSLAPGASMHLHYGQDGTGDLCQVHNIDHVCDSLSMQSCDIITADGGFDFSANFNNQEDCSMPLIAAEIYAALRLQRLHGTLILKVYDLHHVATLKLLYVLRSCYTTMRLVKPFSSRPANSEKYVVCTRYLGAPAHLLDHMRGVCCALKHHTALPHPTCSAVVKSQLKRAVRMPASFVNDIVRFNTWYVARQVCNLVQTLCLAARTAAGQTQPYPSARGGDGGAGARDGDSRRGQLRKCVKWCHKYGMRINTAALRRLAGGPDLHGAGGGWQARSGTNIV